jgi:AraC-like DNA-binding protein
MSADVLNQVFSTLKVQADIFHNGQYCGNWAIDTSGKHYLSFHLVTHGQCYLMVNDNKDEIVTLKQGDMVLFPHDAKHCISSDSSFSSIINTAQSQDLDGGLQSDGTGLVCGYFVHEHPLVKQMTDYLPESIVVSQTATDEVRLSTFLKLLIQESLTAQKDSSFVLEKLSECVLAVMLAEYISLDQGLFAALANNKLNPAVSAIISAPSTKWTLEELAQLCNMSRTTFSELFRSVVNLPVMEFVTQWRISVAYRLLKDQSVSTLAAALEVGYESESSFSKAFKRVLGVSPGAVRAKLTT